MLNILEKSHVLSAEYYFKSERWASWDVEQLPSSGVKYA